MEAGLEGMQKTKAKSYEIFILCAIKATPRFNKGISSTLLMPSPWYIRRSLEGSLCTLPNFCSRLLQELPFESFGRLRVCCPKTFSQSSGSEQRARFLSLFFIFSLSLYISLYITHTLFLSFSFIAGLRIATV